MNSEMGTAITGFPKTNSSLSRQRWRTRSEPGYSTPVFKSLTEPFWGPQFAVACNPGTLAEFAVGGWAPPTRLADEAWAVPEGYGLAMSGQYVNLAGAPFMGQGVLGCGMVSGSIMPAAAQELVFEYTLQVPTATGFGVNATTAYVNATLPTIEPPLVGDQEVTAALTSAIDRAFASGEFLEFEDGVENEFTSQLMSMVKVWGGLGVRELATFMFRPGVRADIVAQALLCLGRIDDEDSYTTRARTLRRGLLAESAKVRDAAAVGIASISDLGASADLAKAIERETIPSLKEDMRAVLASLKNMK